MLLVAVYCNVLVCAYLTLLSHIGQVQFLNFDIMYSSHFNHKQSTTLSALSLISPMWNVCYQLIQNDDNPFTYGNENDTTSIGTGVLTFKLSSVGSKDEVPVSNTTEPIEIYLASEFLYCNLLISFKIIVQLFIFSKYLKQLKNYTRNAEHLLDYIIMLSGVMYSDNVLIHNPWLDLFVLNMIIEFPTSFTRQYISFVLTHLY